MAMIIVLPVVALYFFCWFVVVFKHVHLVAYRILPYSPCRELVYSFLSTRVLPREWELSFPIFPRQFRGNGNEHGLVGKREWYGNCYTLMDENGTQESHFRRPLYIVLLSGLWFENSTEVKMKMISAKNWNGTGNCEVGMGRTGNHKLVAAGLYLVRSHYRHPVDQSSPFSRLFTLDVWYFRVGCVRPSFSPHFMPYCHSLRVFIFPLMPRCRYPWIMPWYPAEPRRQMFCLPYFEPKSAHCSTPAFHVLSF